MSNGENVLLETAARRQTTKPIAGTSMPSRDAAIFLRWFFGATIICALPLAPLFMFLYVAGEIVGVDGVVSHQVENGGIYSSDTVNLEYQHHLALFRVRKPEIVALGSSRVGTLSPDCFKQSFVNLTGMLRWLPEADAVYADIVAARKPQTVIIGVDHNWFHPDYRGNPAWTRNSRTNWAVSTSAFRHLVDLMLMGKLTVEDMGRIVRDRSPNLGIQAKLFDVGTDEFGVRRWGTLEFRESFRAAELAMRGGQTLGTFFRGEAINEQAWTDYLALIEKVRRDGIRVIGFMTPMPPTVIDTFFATGDVGWLRELRHRVQALPNHIDIFDPRDLGIVDKDFVDESHIGNRATKTICDVLKQRFPL